MRPAKPLQKGCLAIIAFFLVISTVAFGTGALYMQLHDSRSHPRHPKPGKLALLAVVVLVPLAGAGYLMYLDFWPTGRRP